MATFTVHLGRTTLSVEASKLACADGCIYLMQGGDKVFAAPCDKVDHAVRYDCMKDSEKSSGYGIATNAQ